MASARGLILTSGLLSAASIQRYAPCSLRANLCPLLTQIRHRNKKQTRFKAPPEPKQKEKWTRTVKEKSIHVKDVKCTNSSVLNSRVPVDDVWIRTYYPRPKFSLEECLIRHKELADPTMLDNMDGFVYADMKLNMKTNKKTKFLSSVKGTILLPHQFEQSEQQKIAVFYKKREDMEKAYSLGASYVGCEDLVKQIVEGVVDKDDIDVVLCTPDAITELIPIRSQLRDRFPSKAKAALGQTLRKCGPYTQRSDLHLSERSRGCGQAAGPLGQLKMPNDQLKANFYAYIDAMCKGRAKTLGPLITQMFVVAPPSSERFLLPVEDYVPGYEKTESKETESDSEDEAEA